jgi:hypothetical protein
MKYVIAMLLATVACGSSDTCPIQDGSVDDDIVDADVSDISDAPPRNTCNVVNSYPTHTQKFNCQINDKTQDYYWRSWSQYISCSDTANPCPSGSVCLSTFLGAGRCATDVAPYCPIGDTKYYCYTYNDAGDNGWVWQINGDCMKDNCPDGAACGVEIYGYGGVIGMCGQ